MNIKINSVHFDADKKLKDFINNKVKKLYQFNEEIIEAEVFLRLDNNQGQDNKLAEIKIEIPGGDLFADKKANTFEQAIDGCVNALKRQINKYKDKNKRS